uniref:Secreted protein n=1 Tax=Chromera velia CCMP2878 TaxID=1169474 RepID=A0A0G4HLB4_9ALVE|eukprot:Cvel_7421.t1-p1 / transcript=Cvel_7421.t1 / gene=Cvel_7421 / organism=Chromera_velia_CCMP2878 / gene_product=hypothetical protein / transcript_product=hypothetical protein / location=Cvel_scaffold387:74211-74957(-) / protein_length=249 / sequence_SO=supercontig / SO=protein_coding / is_pseudo=false
MFVRLVCCVLGCLCEVDSSTCKALRSPHHPLGRQDCGRTSAVRLVVKGLLVPPKSGHAALCFRLGNEDTRAIDVRQRNTARRVKETHIAGLPSYFGGSIASRTRSEAPREGFREDPALLKEANRARLAALGSCSATSPTLGIMRVVHWKATCRRMKTNSTRLSVLGSGPPTAPAFCKLLRHVGWKAARLMMETDFAAATVLLTSASTAVTPHSPVSWNLSGGMVEADLAGFRVLLPTPTTSPARLQTCH